MKTYDLTSAQLNILAMQRFYPDTAIGNQGMAVLYHEKHSLELLEQAVHCTIKVHEGLRMRMTANDKQYISDEIPESIEIKHFHNRGELDSFASEISKKPLIAPDIPQFVFYLFELEGKQGIYACLSHMICDATTSAICLMTIGHFYETLKNDISSPLPTIPGYTDFIHSDMEYLNSPCFEKDREFWNELYGTSPASSKINAVEASHATAKRHEHRLSTAAENALHILAKKWKVTPAVLFETIMTIYLHRLNTFDKDVTIAIPVHNRKGYEKQIAGMRVLTLPFTVPVSPESTVFEWAQTVRKLKNNIFRHIKYPLPLIQEHLRSLGARGRLYHVMVNYHSEKIPHILDTFTYSSGANESALCLHIDDRYNEGKHMLTFDYQTEVFPDEKEIELLAKRIEYMFCQCVANRDLKVSDIEIVAPEEKKLLEYFNETSADIPDCCIHTLFEQTAKKYPERAAVIFHGNIISYQELEKQSAAVAAFLCNKIIPGEIVPVIAKRSEIMIAAMLGILRTGCAFMLVDPNYPAARISQMLNDTGSTIVLTDNSNFTFSDSKNPKQKISCIDITGIDLKNSAKTFEDKGKPDDICYVVFTSGSTGQPKGIAVSHKNTVNYVTPDKRNILGKCIPLDAQNIISITNPIFDIFITETLLPLVNGMTIILGDEKESSDPVLTAELIMKYKPQVLQTTPTKLKLLLSRPEGPGLLASLRSLLIGGENFPTELLDIIQKNSKASVMNVYGPSEATVWCTADDVANGDITIGMPIANMKLMVLDENKRLMPIGAKGELYISGMGLAKGYIGRPGLTKKLFIKNPFGGRMYSSGDMAYRRCDGKLVFLGRRDGQVKLRGQRIELGEIESVMSDFEGISLAAAAVHNVGERQILCGYYTSNTTIDEERLRLHMRKHLPVYMVPQFFKHLMKMPMTANGKTYRKALPVIDFKKRSGTNNEPMSDTEEKITQILEKELHITGINREDDIFLIGGDSLAVISFVSYAYDEWGIMLKVSDVFAHPQIKELAAFIDKQTVQRTDTARFIVTEKDSYKLLPQQAVHYRDWKSDPDSFTYHIGYKFILNGKVDRDKIKNAVLKVIKSDKTFNCRIEEIEGEAYAIYDPTENIAFERFSNESDFRKPFNLRKSPLVHLGETDNSLLIDLHHIIADGASIQVLFRRIANCYINGSIKPEKTWLGDYAEYFEKLDHSDAYNWFSERFSGKFKSLTLPEENTRLTGGEFINFPISDELYAQMKESVKKHKTTMTAFTLAAFAEVCSQETGGVKDIFTMMSFQNRRHETEGMIGMFSTSQPVRITILDDKIQYIKEVTDMLTKQYEFQELPMDMIAENVDLSALPQIDISFIYQPEYKSDLPTDFPTLQRLASPDSIMPLAVNILPQGEHCSIGIFYKRDKFTKNYIKRFGEKYIDKINALSIYLLD